MYYLIRFGENLEDYCVVRAEDEYNATVEYRKRGIVAKPLEIRRLSENIGRCLYDRQPH